MLTKPNEYKLSLLRNFGTEQLSLTATIYSRSTDAQQVTDELVEKFQNVMFKAYQMTIDRSEIERNLAQQRLKERQEKEAKEKIKK